MAQLLAEFLAEVTETKPAIIGRGILPIRSKMIIGGAAKSNKSFVALNLALDMAKGRNAFNAMYANGTAVFPITKTWRVLYLEQEIGAEGLKNRLRGMVPPEQAYCDFFVHSKDTAMRFDTAEGLAAIEAEIASAEPNVVIFDPLSKMHLADENSAQEMGRIMRTGDYLIQKYGVSLIYVHHTGLAVYDPQSTRRGGARLRGSSAVFADVDTFLELNRTSAAHTAEPVLSLSFELRQGAPILPVYLKRCSNGKVEYLGENSIA